MAKATGPTSPRTPSIQLDLSPFPEKYAGRASGKGQKAYHPAMMLKILIYSYCVGIFPSFQEQNLLRFGAVFVEAVRIAQEAGLAAMGTQAVDRSRVKANASKHKAMSYKRM